MPKLAYLMRKLQKRLPILIYLPGYNPWSILSDLVSGIAVGLVTVPSCMAYSILAGVPPQYGLYSACFSGIVYSLFGTCKEASLGPTAITSILVHETTNGRYELAIVLCFLTGLVQIIMAFTNCSIIADFISVPVTSGLVSAIAVMVITAMVPDLIGLQIPYGSFVTTWKEIILNFPKYSIWDAIMGFICLVFCLALKVVKVKTRNKVLRTLTESLSYCGGSILLVLCTLVAYYVSDKSRLRTVGDIPSGLPHMQPFWSGDYFRNSTKSNGAIFLEIVEELNFGIVIVPLVSFFENMATCKSFAKKKPAKGKQELLALGMVNLVNSFAQGYPSSAGLCRSSINHLSGVKSQLSGTFTSLIVLLSLLLLTPYLYYIPKSCIAAVLISAVITKIDVKILYQLWKSNKLELIPPMVSFMACVFLPFKYGFLISVVSSLVFVLYKEARPKIKIEKYRSPNNIDYLVVIPYNGLLFPSSDYLRKIILKKSDPYDIPVALDCSYISSIDYTSVVVLENLAQYFHCADRPLFLFNMGNNVRKYFEKLQLKQIGLYYNREDIDELLKMM